jgi:hypothetical protein
VRVAREELIESFREIVSVIERPTDSARTVLENLLVSPPPMEQRRAGEGEYRQTLGPVADRVGGWMAESRARFDQRLEEMATASEEDPQARYAHGVYTVAYAVEGRFESPDLASFRHLIEQVQGHETGWPPWLVLHDEGAPVPLQGAVEAWLYERRIFADPAHSDFWRAAPSGLLYLLRGYDDDSVPDRFPPGTQFDVTLPLWELAPCLLHAERMAQALGVPQANIRLRVVWEGLSGRHLSTWASPRRLSPFERIAVQDRVQAEVSVRADRIAETLPELLQRLTADLYTIFDFFTPPSELIREEVARLRGVG